MSNKFDIFNHVSISAGAGSGKTYTLSRRYINILVGFNLFFEGDATKPPLESLKPSRPGEIVTITYTEAGALEMKSRIYALIQNVIAYIDGDLDPEHDDYTSIAEAISVLGDSEWISHVRNALINSLSELSSATISTIHSYCLELIEQYGDYLKLDAKPQIVGDDEKIVAYTDAYRAVLNNEADLIKEINQTLALYKLSQIAQKYSFNTQFREAFNAYVVLCDDESFSLRDVWMATLLPAHKERIEQGLYALRSLAVQDHSKSDFCDALTANLASVLRGSGEWIDYTGQFRKNKNTEEDTFEAVKRLRDTVKSLRWTKVVPEAEEHYLQTLIAIHALFLKIYARFRQILSDQGYTDFETILQQANTLLDYDITIPTRYFMVDEFQDTNSYQWGIVTKAAAKNSANIFIVGDEKQSIFAFQGADVSVFAQASKAIGIDKPISMEVNRRSDRSIIALVNDIFAPAMAPREAVVFETIPECHDEKLDECIALYNRYSDFSPIIIDFEARYDKLDTPKTKGEGTLAILATPVDHTDDECGDECSETLQELRHIASFIQSVIHTDEYPQYSDVKKAYNEGKKAIAVLFDSRKFMLPLKQRLLELGIRAKVSDSGNFFDTKEVNDTFIVLKLLAIMDTLDWGNLSSKIKYVIIGALRSNILRYDTDRIESIMRQHELPEELLRWKQLSLYRPLHEMIAMIVQESSLLHFYRHIDGYEQREANIEQLIGMAYDYSTHSGSNLKGFVDELESFIHNENVSEDEAFVIEEGVGSIEIVTMHGSKGLEWPMVIIGSMNRSFLGMSKQETLVYDRFDSKEMIGFKIGDYEPLVYKFIKERINQKHIAERKRLFYVAMTRPEHHLVMSTAINHYGKEPRLCYNCGDNNYFSLINNVLGIDYAELYEKNIDQVRNIQVYYPPEWKGITLGSPSIEVIDQLEIQPQSFTRFSTIRPSGKIDSFSFLEDDLFDAGSAGTVVHKILEKHWHELDNDAIFERFFDEYSVPESFKYNIIRMSRNFQSSLHYKKLKEGAEGYFEHDFSMNQDGNRIRGSIDLFYYDSEANGWVIVDFKTTSIKGKDPQTVILENGYDQQLEMYAMYLSSIVGRENISKSEICWLKL